VSDKLSEELKKIHECGDYGNCLEGLSEKAEVLENRSSGAIEGVPKGWKIKRIGKPIIHKETFLNAFGDITFCDSNMGDNKVYVIIERDVQIIDMSQCKVDVEYRARSQSKWYIDTFSNMENHIYCSNDYFLRVRQDHYFSFEILNRNIPGGLLIQLKLHGFNDNSTIYRSEDISEAYQLGTMRGYPITGIKVIGTQDGWAYAHELGGELNKAEN